MSTTVISPARTGKAVLLAAEVMLLLMLAVGQSGLSAGAAKLAPPALPQGPDIPVPSGCSPDWEVVPSPNAGTGSNELWGIEAISGTDVWAVGNHAGPSADQTLTLHWDGSTLEEVPSPNVGGNPSHLTAVSAVSAGDIWAVGYYDSGTVERTLIEHWDGNSWSIVPSPNVGSNENYLTAVDAISSSDVWAVGYYFPGGPAFNTLTLHWDGSAWSVVASPNSGNNFLTGVAAVSSTDVWAVGYHLTASFLYETLVLRWNGSAWTIVPSPSIGSDGSFLNAVSVASSSDVWAVGYYIDGFTWLTLILRWNGSTWAVVPSPNVGTVRNFLLSVTAASGSDAWAAGYYYVGDTSHTLVERWNGSAWNVVPSADPGTLGNQLNAIDAVSPGDVWAAGQYVNSTAYQTLVERYNPCSGSPTPTPVATFTATGTAVPSSTAAPSQTPTLVTTPQATPSATRTATRTATATSASPTATSTMCALHFTDVPPDNTFYPFVRCLACKGIVGGYPCGGPGEPCDLQSNPYFRPNNYVTRGQLSKIVSLAAGFSEPVSGQTFEDVPQGSTFYEYVERLASREVMSGYPCGGPGEPCVPPGNRPYFRPNAGATRGQLTKIVSNAAGFNDPMPQGQYTFADVLPGSTFWVYVERLLLNRPGVMSGYPCGGPNEPCDSQSRPYFRVGNPLTRGQTAKIVASTFFPGCSPP